MLAYQRFIPSEFGVEDERVTALPPFQAVIDQRKKIRRATEAAGIPFTFPSSTCLGKYFMSFLLRPQDQPEELSIFGTGEANGL
ncbi:hypothetical protein U1Q18_023283 [Sarracenia purpurea var. burkii]